MELGNEVRKSDQTGGGENSENPENPDSEKSGPMTIFALEYFLFY
jgi:hypothetical protein